MDIDTEVSWEVDTIQITVIKQKYGQTLVRIDVR